MPPPPRSTTAGANRGRIVDPNSAVTHFAYDSAGRRTCAARPGDSLSHCSIDARPTTSPPRRRAVVGGDGGAPGRPASAADARATTSMRSAARATRDTFRVVDGAADHRAQQPRRLRPRRARVARSITRTSPAPARPNNGATTLRLSSQRLGLHRSARARLSHHQRRRDARAARSTTAALTTVVDEEGQRTETDRRPVRPHRRAQTVYGGDARRTP